MRDFRIQLKNQTQANVNESEMRTVLAYINTIVFRNQCGPNQILLCSLMFELMPTFHLPC